MNIQLFISNRPNPWSHSWRHNASSAQLYPAGLYRYGSCLKHIA